MRPRGQLTPSNSQADRAGSTYRDWVAAGDGEHTTDELVEFKPFGRDVARATAEYANCERKYRERGDYEIVLVGADSRETLEVTHSRYFKRTDVVPF